MNKIRPIVENIPEYKGPRIANKFIQSMINKFMDGVDISDKDYNYLSYISYMKNSQICNILQKWFTENGLMEEIIVQ